MTTSILRRAKALRARWLLAPPLGYALLLAVFLLLRRYAGLRVPLAGYRNDDGGFFTVLSLAFHGHGVALPAAYLALSAFLVRAGRRRLGAALAIAAAPVLALSIWARWIEPSTLVERRYDVRSARAPARPLRILHVSDLQTDGACRRERLAEEAARREDPDLVIVTGDFTNGFDDGEDVGARLAAARAFFGALHARHGVFAVLGDWDGWGEEWPGFLGAMIEGTGVRVLRNEGVRLDVDGAPVFVWGVEGGGPSPDPIVPDLSAEPGLRVVAVHAPDVAADLLLPGRADLVLAGHTHGGQVVLPLLGALVTHSARGFVGGLYDVAGTPLVVSRGIGMRGGAAPRVRLNCPPEIGWITVRR